MRSNVRVSGRSAGLATLCVLFGVVLAAGGCTHKSATTPPSSAPSSPAGSPSPSVDPVLAKAIDAYNGYIAAYASASQTANPDDPNLANYIGDPLLTLTRHNIRVLKNAGQVQLGAQTATVKSSQANLNANPPTVTINACLDYSQLKLVYQATHSPVPNNSLKQTKVSVLATVAQYPDGRWLVNDTKSGGSSC